MQTSPALNSRIAQATMLVLRSDSDIRFELPKAIADAVAARYRMERDAGNRPKVDDIMGLVPQVYQPMIKRVTIPRSRETRAKEFAYVFIEEPKL